MKTLIVLLLSFGASFSISADEIKIKDFRKSFDKKFDAPKVGKFRIKYKYAGEPQAKPADVTIFLTCEGLKEKKIYYSDICSLNSYEYSDRSLVFQVQKARVDQTSKVYCDQYLTETIKLGDICAKEYKR